MIQISERLKKIKPSPTLALAAKASELAAQGHDVISLSVGEPDWDTLPCSAEAGIEAIRKGLTKYSPSNGTPELRKAIAASIKKQLSLEYDFASQITVSTGGKFVLHSAFQSVLNPGDEVIIPAPYWVSYPTMVEMAEAKPVIVPTHEGTGFKMTAEMLRKALTPKTRAIVYSSPSNPTGEVYSKAEFAEWVRVLKDFPNVLVITDDIYNTLVFDGSVAPHILEVEPGFKDRTLVVNGASKTFSMTGWRIGWASGPKEIISAMTRFQSQTVSCAATFAQKAAAVGLEKGDDELRQSVVKLKARLEYSLKLMQKIPQLKARRPGGAFYLWVDITSCLNKKWRDQDIKTSSDFARLFLEDKKVAVVPGIEFGQDGYFRMSFVLSETKLDEAFKRLGAFVAEIA
ncbi:MAG TPA: pyridoxal phosphate-dependent aminotransferase [Bdellovibrionales bacterium]|nr:pyridoxal phosphate-dependent aminotransferase [Bdellovibrionales bacterium]